MDEKSFYGYSTPENTKIVKMLKGQNIAGYPIGIIYIDDVYYPMVPGNIVNGYTFDFPVRLKEVSGLDIPNLFQAGDEVYDQILIACRKLENEGCRAISSACGFFGNYQSRLAAEMDIPIAISSLVQIPWIAALLKPEQKIGILTADKASLTNQLLDSCGVSENLKKRLVIKDLRHEKEFSCILEGRGEFDNGVVRDEVAGKALEIMNEHDEVGAILLECSDMPPYAYAVQAVTKLPVFDFVTLIRWLHSSVCQRPYYGFI